MSRFVAVALVLLANPCLGQISLESVLEGFESDKTEADAGEFDNNQTESVSFPVHSERSELYEIFSGFDEPRLSRVASDTSFAGKMPAWLRLGGKLS